MTRRQKRKTYFLVGYSFMGTARQNLFSRYPSFYWADDSAFDASVRLVRRCS